MNTNEAAELLIVRHELAMAVTAAEEIRDGLEQLAAFSRAPAKFDVSEAADSYAVALAQFALASRLLLARVERLGGVL